MTDVYTIDEVAHHNNAKDMWIVIEGAVYNVTAFHKEHPGGEEVLLQVAGKDATDSFESVGHTLEAIKLRENFKIGELVDGPSSGKSKATNTEIKEPMEDDWQNQEPKKEKVSWNRTYVCVAVALYAMIVYLLI